MHVCLVAATQTNLAIACKFKRQLQNPKSYRDVSSNILSSSDRSGSRLSKESSGRSRNLSLVAKVVINLASLSTLAILDVGDGKL